MAMSRDVRVIIIKLADRLHNMRTVAYLKRETQLRKATETLEIYAPLAHRLGIYSIKWELEDLSFATLHPRRYEEIKSLVAARRGRQGGLYQRDGGGALAPPARDRDRGRGPREGQALLLHLQQDGAPQQGVQRDLRPRRTSGRGGRRARLLRRLGRHPLHLEAHPGPFQGLHRDAEVQHVPVASHDGDVERGEAAGDPDPDLRDGHDGRVWHRRPLDVQARPHATARWTA